MTGVTCRLLCIGVREIIGSYLYQHSQHHSRLALRRLFVAGEVVGIVAVIAIHTEAGFDHMHPALQLLLRFDKLQDLKVFRKGRLRLRSLSSAGGFGITASVLGQKSGESDGNNGKYEESRGTGSSTIVFWA